MNALEQALTAKFSATASLVTAFPGNTRASGGVGLHWDTATKGINAQPYLVAQTIPQPTATSKYGGVTLADVRVQFKAFATDSGTNSGRVVALDALETFCGVFDEFSPTLASGTNVFVQRESEPFAMKLPEQKAGQDEYQAIVVYHYAIQPA